MVSTRAKEREANAAWNPSPVVDTLKPSFATTVYYLMFMVVPIALGAYAGYNTYFTEGTHEDLVAHHRGYGKLLNVVEASIPMFAVLILVEVAFTWWAGTLSDLYRTNDALSSLFAGSLQQLVVIFTRGLTLYPWLFIRTRWAVLNPDDGSWTHWACAFLLVELLYYAFHRAAHEVNLLWSGHIVHHSSQEYNLTTALRQGVIQALTSWPFYLPLAPFISFPMFYFHASLNTMLQFWIHTRTIDHLPFPLEYIINSPSAHRVHHGRNPQYIDKNYGGTLIIFDIIFGTFQLEEEPVVFGVTHDDGTWNPAMPQITHLLETWRVARMETTWWGAARCFLDRGPEYNYFALHPTHRDHPPKAVTRATETRYDSVAKRPLANAYAYTVGFLAVAHTIAAMLLMGGCGVDAPSPSSSFSTSNTNATSDYASTPDAAAGHCGSPGHPSWNRPAHVLCAFLSMTVASAVLDRSRLALWIDCALRLPLIVWAVAHGSPGGSVAGVQAEWIAASLAMVSGTWHFAVRCRPGDSRRYDPYLRPRVVGKP